MVGAVLIFSGGTASAKQFATLRLLGGQVAIQHGNGAFETGQDGTSLREGDTVRTGPDGRASIEYFDGSLTRLDFDTSFTLVTLETRGDAAASRVIQSSQAEGNSYHRVAELNDAQSRFEIETPTATAWVHGTGYALLVDEGSTTIAVVEGVVTAGGSTGSVEIPAGEMAVVGTDGLVGPVQAIPSELLDGDWLMFNRCADHETPACAEGDGGEGDGGGSDGPTEPPKGPGQGSRGRSRRPPPRAPAVRAARPAERRLRHRSTDPRRRDSRQPHDSVRLRCVFGSRMHRTTPTATPCRVIGVSVTGRRSRAAGPFHTRTTIPAGIP